MGTTKSRAVITDLAAGTNLTASRLIEALRALRDHDAPLNALQIRLLLTVAQQPGASLREITKAVGEKETTVSRALGDLSRHKRTLHGPELVAVDVDAQDRRVHRFSLTLKGREVVQELLHPLGGPQAR